MISILVYFHMDFRIVVSISKGKEMTSFDGDYIKSVDKFENYFIVIRLNFPIHEHGLSFCLF